MKSYVGAVILLALVANVMAGPSDRSKVNLKNVVESCYKKNHATCKGIISFRKGLERNVVGTNKDVLKYFACLNVDSGVLVPNKPFNLDNLNRWYATADWVKLDAVAEKCSRGDNAKISNAGDRIYQFLICVHSDKNYKTLKPTTSVFPATCQ